MTRDVDAFLEDAEDVIDDWESSPDVASWSADGSHEHDRRLHRTSRLLEISAWLDLLPYILGAVVFVVILVLIVLVVVL